MSLAPLYPDLVNDLHVSNTFGPPPRFPLASTGPGKVRHLSGPSGCAALQIPVTHDRDRRKMKVKIHEPPVATAGGAMELGPDHV